MDVNTQPLVLHTVGARTGRPRANPVAFLRDGDRLLVFASNAGRPNHPAWYHNLVANPQVVLEVPDGQTTRAWSARAVPLTGAERDELFARQAERDPAFAAYQASTERVIPVVALHPFQANDAGRNRAVGEQLLQHHATLRATLAALRAELDQPHPAPRLGHDLLGHCLTFCDQLHHHHLREDGAFSAFEDRFPALVPAIARLRAEHRTVASTLTRLRELSARVAEAEPAELAALRAELTRLAEDLERHFDAEERQLLPSLGVAR